MATSIQQVLGVPPLLNNIPPINPILLTSDLVSFSGLSAPQWGIFLDGAPVVEFKSFLGIDFRQGWAISDYPVENGAFESYDKVDLPFDARVKFASGGSPAEIEATIATVTATGETLSFYDVVTPEVIYLNCNVQHYDYSRTNTNGAGMVTVEVWLLEVRVVPKRGADVVFPSSAATINDGFIQSLPAAASLFSSILSLIT